MEIEKQEYKRLKDLADSKIPDTVPIKRIAIERMRKLEEKYPELKSE